MLCQEFPYGRRVQTEMVIFINCNKFFHNVSFLPLGLKSCVIGDASQTTWLYNPEGNIILSLMFLVQIP